MYCQGNFSYVLNTFICEVATQTGTIQVLTGERVCCYEKLEYGMDETGEMSGM